MWQRTAALPALAAVVIVSGFAQQHDSPSSGSAPLPLAVVGEIALPGDGSRFDYAGLDRGLLFVAHLGAGEVIEVDLHARQVIRTIPNVAQVHGVLVVPGLRRVFATATGTDEAVALDEDTGAVLARAGTGKYPDGLAYDPRRNTVWTTNESGGTETVLDATSLQHRGTVEVGGEVGNVAYDPDADRMLVAVQGRDELAVIDPDTLTVQRRITLPGCDHPHGLALDPGRHVAFVACDHNAALVTVDEASGQLLATDRVGEDPDVLAYDPGARRLYVACESGWVTVLDVRDRTPTVTGSALLADGAHVVAVDPDTHHSYFPVPSGQDGHPALLERAPQ